MYENILISTQGQTAIVTINREDKLNALNMQTLSELSAALDEVAADSTVRGVIITGQGAKAFVAGADIKEFLDQTAMEASALSRYGQEHVMNKIHHFGKPVVAAINGFALGGGLELALACHMRIAVSSAKMGLPEVSLGIIPGYGGTQRLTHLIGRGKALEMILTADMITASEAKEFGLINHFVETYEELMEKTLAILERTYTRSSTALSAAIEAVNAGLEDSSRGYEAEIHLFGKCFGSADMKEGVAAFLEKRKPNF